MSSPTVVVSTFPDGRLVRLWRSEKAILVLGYLPLCFHRSRQQFLMTGAQSWQSGGSVSVDSGTWVSMRMLVPRTGLGERTPSLSMVCLLCSESQQKKTDAHPS